MLHDGLLDYIEADQDGIFGISYEGMDFQELFNKKSDIYLRARNRD